MNNKNTYLNKRSILRRMLKFAATFLGVKRVELLDPIVVLFIESLAEELYKLSGEINNIESRILEKLSNMLVPNISVSSMPAHAILHASSSEIGSIVTKETDFLLDGRSYKWNKTINKLSFHPVCNTKIWNGDIRYLITNGLCYSIDTDQAKTLIARSRNSEFIQRNSFWIGLNLNEAISSLKNLSFYFDFASIAKKEEYLNVLPYTEWLLNNTTINLNQGLYIMPNEEENKIVELFSNYDISNGIDESIISVYNNHFLTVDDDIDLNTVRTNFPEELKKYFTDQFADDFNQPLIWIEVKYPTNFKPEIMDAMQISINAFPVANKHLHSKVLKVNDVLQIIPLETSNNEYLISVDSIVDSQGRHYYELPFDNTPTTEYRTYSLRRGGYERYNTRDAREYLTNLADTLNSNSSFLSKDTEEDESLKEIHGQVHDLVKHIKRTVVETGDQNETQSYVLIDQLKEDEILFIKYWITNCEQANNIKSGAVLDAVLQPNIKASSIVLLSPAMGGKSAPQSIERQNLYQKSLIEGAIISSNEDIVTFCRKEFNDTIKNVSVRKGLMTSSNPKEGFLRTIDVYLTPRKELNKLFHEKDIAFLKQKLEKNSPATFNYRVFINN